MIFSSISSSHGLEVIPFEGGLIDGGFFGADVRIERLGLACVGIEGKDKALEPTLLLVAIHVFSGANLLANSALAAFLLMRGDPCILDVPESDVRRLELINHILCVLVGRFL